MEHKEYRKLHAEWYEYLSGDKSGGPEIAFWLRCIAEAGQPVLELGSGTGAVLIPLLAKGIDITGIDTSEDMMARCRAICEERGLRPVLYEQSMLDFSVPRQFALTILPSGSLSLFTKDEDIRAMFGRVMAHLRPGGTFVYGFEPLPDKPGGNNDQWTGGWTRGPGDIVIAWRRHWRHDAQGRIWECLFIVEKFVGGRLVETEANERTGRSFGVEEAMDYARAAGFEDIRVKEAWAEERSPVVLCRKPA